MQIAIFYQRQIDDWWIGGLVDWMIRGFVDQDDQDGWLKQLSGGVPGDKI